VIATVELETLTTQRCRECGNHHLIRAEVVAADQPVPPALVGFFGACPYSGERVWLVVSAPERPEPVRLVRMGPIDDESWEPSEPLSFEAPHRPLGRAGASFPPSGVKNGGLRDATRGPDVLRRAWGCPFSS
jgi:hypothetical protein